MKIRGKLANFQRKTLTNPKDKEADKDFDLGRTLNPFMGVIAEMKHCTPFPE